MIFLILDIVILFAIFTCIYVGVKNVRLFEEIILLHGGIPVGCDFLSRDIAGYRATGATIKIVTYVPIIPIIERVRVRQMIGPWLSVLAQLQCQIIIYKYRLIYI